MSLPAWTCPNTKCTYDKQLQIGQHCPLCGKEAKGFNLNDFGNLLKEKDALRKSMEKSKEYKRVLRMMKFCPKCGSREVFWASGLPQFWSVWQCRECGYRGPFILEDGKLASKIRKDYSNKKRY